MGKGNYIGGGSVLKVHYRPSKSKSMQLCIEQIAELNSKLASNIISDKEYIRVCGILLREFSLEDKLKLANKMLLPIPSVVNALRPVIPNRKKKGKNRIVAGVSFHKPQSNTNGSE